MVCADTSFLFSLYGSDANTARALRCVTLSGQALTLTALNEFESENAIRFAAFRKAISKADAQAFLAAFTADVAAGHLRVVPCNLAATVREARRLSAQHTILGGPRSFDILHVAAALELGAKEFRTFDACQTALAEAENLTVKP